MDWNKKIAQQCVAEVKTRENLASVAALWPSGSVFKITSTGKYYEKYLNEDQTWYFERSEFGDRFFNPFADKKNPEMETYRMAWLDTLNKAHE